MFVNFPLEFQIFDNKDQLKTKLRTLLQKKIQKCVVITGERYSLNYAKKLLFESNLEPEIFHTLKSNEIDDLYLFEQLIRKTSPSCILAVGGGKVGDFSKRLSLSSNIPLFLVPTTISNDGLISPVAVLNQNGRSVSLPGRMPEAVLLDLQHLRNAPKRYLHAAACDLITNLSSTNDWVDSEGKSKTEYNLGLQLAQIAANNVLNSYTWDLSEDTFLRSVISGQVLSGVAMALAGNSRPCSGSEHLISHAMDYLNIGENTLHGAKVAACSRFCLDLQGFVNNRLNDFFHHFNILKILPGTEDLTVAELYELFDLAKKMRPNRETILDKYNNNELTQKYLKYQSNERKLR
jgi:glycerol-1-phosphate dehydrogenase [NAD(P)+]